MEAQTERIDTKEEFSIMKRARSFVHAGRGFYIFFRTTPNAWIHLAIFIAVLILAFFFKISATELVILLLVASVVFTAETINTAIEIDINLTSPEYHPYARDTKDVAAAAVLIATFFAIIIGAVIFFPYLLDILTMNK